eukprot:m.343572 g.343572  ORF g.343572 m.343572 type:complete len:134 (-) comp23033_c0_seq1:58-459(-)
MSNMSVLNWARMQYTLKQPRLTPKQESIRKWHLAYDNTPAMKKLEYLNSEENSHNDENQEPDLDRQEKRRRVTFGGETVKFYETDPREHETIRLPMRRLLPKIPKRKVRSVASTRSSFAAQDNSNRPALQTLN